MSRTSYIGPRPNLTKAQHEATADSYMKLARRTLTVGEIILNSADNCPEIIEQAARLYREARTYRNSGALHRNLAAKAAT